MNYQVPSYHDLKKNTQNLNRKFGQLSNRYIPPSLETLLEKIKKLQKDYSKRVDGQGLIGFFSDKDLRSSQIDSINSLATKLKNTDTDIEKVRRIILGACFYRMERLKIVHDAKNKYIPSIFKRYISPDSLQSILYLLLKDVLEIKSDNTLDPQTLISRCQDYSEYLMQLNVTQRKYHLDVNPNLFSNINKIINDHQIAAENARAQMRVIKFIQSVGVVLDKITTTIRKMIPMLTEKIQEQIESSASEKTEYFLCNDLEMIDDSLIKNFLQTFELLPEVITLQGVPIPRDKNQVVYLSSSNYIQKKLETVNQCILFGAYMMGFAQCESLSLCSTLHIVLEQALQINTNNPFIPEYNQLDLELKVDSLQQFLEKFHTIAEEIDYSAWDEKNGKEYFERALQIEIAKPRQEHLLSCTG